MEKVNRREFLGRSVAAGVASSFVVSAKGSVGTAGGLKFDLAVLENINSIKNLNL